MRDLFARAAALSFEKHILHLLNNENYSPHKKRRFMHAKQMMTEKGNKETQTVYRTLNIQHCMYVFDFLCSFNQSLKQYWVNPVHWKLLPLNMSLIHTTSRILQFKIMCKILN